MYGLVVTGAFCISVGAIAGAVQDPDDSQKEQSTSADDKQKESVEYESFIDYLMRTSGSSTISGALPKQQAPYVREPQTPIDQWVMEQRELDKQRVSNTRRTMLKYGHVIIAIVVVALIYLAWFRPMKQQNKAEEDLEPVNQKHSADHLLVLFGLILFLAFSIAQLVAGFVGIEEGIGTVWAWVAVVVAFGFRFTLPITVGAFFGAMNVWEWHWALALLFAAPGLVLALPGVLASIFAMAKRSIST